MRTLLIFLSFSFCVQAFSQVRLKVVRSEVSFVSDAPLERIVARNTAATGLLEPATRSFAIQIPVAEFDGFNSPLQREHFNENYMQTNARPKATFAGRIIETIDLSVPGQYAVRAKGELSIHGVVRERIIPCTLVVTAEGVRVTSSFEVLLSDHDIRIPKVVQQKIASVVQVKLDLLFKTPAAP